MNSNTIPREGANAENENRLLREGLHEMKLFVQRLEEGEEATEGSGGKVNQAEGTASAKTLGQKCTWSQVSDGEPRKS